MKLYALSCRLFQAVLKVGNYALGYRTPQCLEGAGCVRELGAWLKEQGLDHVLVVTGSGMLQRGTADALLAGLEAEAISYTLAAYDHPDPTTEDVERGFRAYRDGSCRGIVALGGGSRIDCAKAIAAKAAHPTAPVRSLQGLLKVHKKVPPLIAIPTTSGAGSETTLAAVITDSETHRKAAINDPVLSPKFAVLDPELTVSLPPMTTACTGMDALAHAVEAYTNHTYNTGLENRLAKEAVRLIYDNLETACRDGKNLEARQNMQRAAFYAGRAFTRGCVGYVHAVGHTLGGLYGVSHGLAMAVLLPKVMRQYGARAHRRLAELARACGMTGASDSALAEAFLGWIEQTNRRMGIPERFSVIRPEDVEQMISWAMKEANPLYPVPVIWGREDFRRLILAAADFS